MENITITIDLTDSDDERFEDKSSLTDKLDTYDISKGIKLEEISDQPPETEEIYSDNEAYDDYETTNLIEYENFNEAECDSTIPDEDDDDDDIVFVEETSSPNCFIAAKQIKKENIETLESACTSINASNLPVDQDEASTSLESPLKSEISSSTTQDNNEGINFCIESVVGGVENLDSFSNSLQVGSEKENMENDDSGTTNNCIIEICSDSSPESPATIDENLSLPQPMEDNLNSDIIKFVEEAPEPKENIENGIADERPLLETVTNVVGDDLSLSELSNKIAEDQCVENVSHEVVLESPKDESRIDASSLEELEESLSSNLESQNECVIITNEDQCLKNVSDEVVLKSPKDDSQIDATNEELEEDLPSQNECVNITIEDQCMENVSHEVILESPKDESRIDATSLEELEKGLSSNLESQNECVDLTIEDGNVSNEVVLESPKDESPIDARSLEKLEEHLQLDLESQNKCAKITNEDQCVENVSHEVVLESPKDESAIDASSLKEVLPSNLESQNECVDITIKDQSFKNVSHEVVMESPKDESTIEEGLPSNLESQNECVTITIENQCMENVSHEVVLESPKDESAIEASSLEEVLPSNLESQNECVDITIKDQCMENVSDEVVLESPKDDIPIDATGLEERDEDSPLDLECAKITTTIAEESSEKNDENGTLEYDTSDVDEDALLFESPEDNDECTTPTNLAEEDLLLMDSPEKDEDKMPKRAAILVKGNSMLLKSPSEKSVRSCRSFEGDSLLLSSSGRDERSKHAKNLTGEEDSSPLKSANNKSEVDTPKTATSSFEEDSMLVDSLRGGFLSKDTSGSTEENSLLEKAKSEPNSPKTEEYSLVLNSSSKENESSNNAKNLEVEYSLPLASPKQNIQADTSKTTASCSEEDSPVLDSLNEGYDTSKDASSLIEDNSLVIESPKEKSEPDTPKVGEDSLVLDSSAKDDESSNNAINVEVEDLLLVVSSKGNIEAHTSKTIASCSEEDSPLLNSLKRYEISKEATSFTEDNSLLVTSSKEEESAPNIPKTATNSIEEDSLGLDSPTRENENSNNAINSPKESSEADTPKTTANVSEEDSPLLDSLKGGYETSKDSTSFAEENSLVVAPPKEKSAPNITKIEEDSLVIDSPSTEDESSNNVEVEDSLPHTAKTIARCSEEDSLLLDSTRREDETSKDTTSCTEENALLVESPKESSEANIPKKASSGVEEDSLVLDSPTREDESSNKAITLEVEDSLPLASPKEKSELGTPKIEEYSLVVDSPPREDESSDKNVEVEDSISSASPKENVEADSPKTTASCSEKDSLPLDSTRREDETSKDPTSSTDKDSLLVASPKEKNEPDTPKIFNSPTRNDESSNNSIHLEVEDKSASPNENIEAPTPKTTASCSDKDESSKDVTSFVEDSLTVASPEKKSEPNTSKIVENSLVLDSPTKEDETSNNAINLEIEDSLPFASSKDNIEADTPKTTASCSDEDEISKDATSSTEKNSLLVKTPRETNESNNPKIEEDILVVDSPTRDDESSNSSMNLEVAGSLSSASPKENIEACSEEDSSFLDSYGREDESSNDSTRLEIDDSLSVASPKENIEADTLTTTARCSEENSSFLESTRREDENSKDATNLVEDGENMSSKVEQDSLHSLKQTNKDESKLVEKDTLLLESSISPKSGTKERQSIESTSEDNTILDNNDAIKNDCDDKSLNNEETLTNSEEIRTSLRMQLTNLRRGKPKFDFLKNVQQKRSNNIDKPNAESSEKPFVQPKITAVPIMKKLETKIVRPEETKKVESQEDANVSNAISELRKIINKPKTSTQKPDETIAKKKDVMLENSTNERVRNAKPFHRSNNISLTTTEIRKIIGTLNTDIPEETKSNDRLISETTDNNSNPFVSETLDEFLTDSKLNVSYDIPKSAAEEGIKKDYTVDPVMLVNKQTTKEEEKKEADSKKTTEGIAYKPKTLAEKRRILEGHKPKPVKRLKNVKEEKPLDSRSYVMFKNKKVFLRSKYQSKCLAYVESDVPKETIEKMETANKPSLLKELLRKASPVKYKPGPLSKKHQLQSDYSQWTTELKPLPKVTLSLMPEFQKSVHPNLIGIVMNQWNAEVSDDQVEFALTALQTEEPQEKIFKFDLKYENSQEMLLVRKKLPDEIPEFKIPAGSTKDSVDQEDDDKVVAQVIDNLINYVEIKELAPTLIKDDEDFDIDYPDLPQEKPINKYRKRKRLNNKNSNKTSRELLRLNCKLVTMEEDEDDSKNVCFKLHCRLGCVCSSLECEHMIGVGKHCQKAKCIFECSCPKNASELTSDTVTKIEDISKKHLAKEEKEFTQTVICTNEKTFVVGMSAKPRRVTKLPKKYTEFDEDGLEEKSATTTIKKKLQLLPCTVEMEHLDISGVVPYCWTHYLYNCHCKGTSIPEENKKRKLSSQSKSARNFENSRTSARKVPKKSSQHDEEERLGDSAARIIPFGVFSLPDRKRKILEGVTASDFEHNITQSDRLRALTNQDTHMNESDALKYLLIQDKKLHQRKQQLLNRDEQTCDLPLRKPTTTNQRKRQSAETVEMAVKTFKNYPEYGKKKKIRESKSEPSSSQGSRSSSTTEEISINEAEGTASASKKSLVESVFDGEIICDDSAFLTKMCNNTQQPADSYARILPWTALLNGYLLHRINVYCIWDAPLRLILTKSSIRIRSSKYIDIREKGAFLQEATLKGKDRPGLIRQSETVRDIVKWLINGTLHTKYTASSLSFLLVEVQPERFEIRGCCTQKPSVLPKQRQPTAEKPSLPESNIQSPSVKPSQFENNFEPTFVEPSQPESNIEPSEEASVGTDTMTVDELALSQTDITEIKHKNMYNQVMSLFITKNIFKSRELIEDGCDDDLSDNLYMWVELPEVCGVGKWRVIFLKNDFMYLYFKKVKYSIKYTDIVELTEIAKRYSHTLMVRNLEIRRSHNHPLYGLYFSPKYMDRFFVGPYDINFMDEDIDTLVYKNQSLVSNSSLKISGDYVEKCGAWMYEREELKVPVVDLTGEDDIPPPAPVPSTSSASSSIQYQMVPQETVPNRNNMSVPVFRVISSTPRQPSEFNRFIVTNIPHFGYLGAFQPENAQSLEVSWPFEDKILLFESCDSARDFIQKRLKQVLQPIPVTFDIQVIVLLDLDRKENQPIKTKYLAGNCICGSFGTLNINEVSKEFCEKELKMPKEHIIALFANKVRQYTQSRMSQLAKLNSITYNNEQVSEEVVIEKTKSEIHRQRLLYQQKQAEIEALENKTRNNLKKVYILIKDLPKMERNLETRILRETLRIRPKGLGAVYATKVVEIDDNDKTNVPSTSTSVVAFNVPSTSAVGVNVPSTSVVNVPSTSVVNVPSTSKSVIAVNLPSTSKSVVDFKAPGTSLLKPVSTVTRPAPNLYPIKVFRNNKSLLKVNVLKNVPTTTDKASEGNSSEDVVWID